MCVCHYAQTSLIYVKRLSVHSHTHTHTNHTQSQSETGFLSISLCKQSPRIE